VHLRLEARAIADQHDLDPVARRAQRSSHLRAGRAITAHRVDDDSHETSVSEPRARGGTIEGVKRAGVRTVVVIAAAAGCQQLFGLDPPKVAGSDAPGPQDAQLACSSLFMRCNVDVLATCSTLGSAEVDTPCSWGCVPSPQAHCGELQPAGGGVAPGDVAAGSGLQAITLPDVVIDTDTGAILGSASNLRGSGTGVIAGIDYERRGSVAVFRFASLDVPAGVTVSATGVLPFALVTDGPITIEGIFDLTLMCMPRFPNAGGGMGAMAGSDAIGSGGGSGGASDNTTGGGGGGYGGAGGTGGRSTGPGASGGQTFGDAMITVLAGGGGGGGGGASSTGDGGAGGAGIQLASNRSITIAGSGGINAGGCRGRGAISQNAGGGGGAGGTVLLEAPTVSIAGAIAVNGGGGGAGGDCAGGGTMGAQHGQLSRSAALGGPACGAGNGSGGNGGASTTLAGASATSSNHSGGGGGGVGRIRIDTKTGSADTMGSVMSPDLTDSPTTCTQGAAVVQ
jgi:hypothetical protein